MARRSRSGNKSDGAVNDDGHLIGLVRRGDLSAFDHLYKRHVSIASTVARRHVDNPSDAEDVVAEAFQSVLQSLVSGKGPDTFFRAYLLSTVTRLSHQQNRKSSKVVPSGDDSLLDQTLAEPDAVVQAFESRAVAQAFRALPERWQAVLWYLDVERMKPAVVAPILGLSANAVSALAVRAREGLRRQYLQFHLSENAGEACAEFASKLGYFIRGGLSSGAEVKVRAHVEGCARCTAALAELKDVQGTMRAVLLPLVTGIPLAAWVGKSAGLGVLGGILPVKGFLAIPALAHPMVMAVSTAAAVGLMLGAVGSVDLLSPGASWDRQTPETGSVDVEASPPFPSAVPNDSPPAPAADPPVDEQPLTVVTASANWSRLPDGRGGTGSSGTTWDIAFAASGSGPLEDGVVVFSVVQDILIQASSVQAPAGWSCSADGINAVSCMTQSIQRDDLHFRVETAPAVPQDGGMLRYSFSGTGIATVDFTGSY
ncbi:sigma-70 family RNA polymerase sigma factor [Paenarthrobacter sp. NPDC089316]|uniref:sigma-70 family RNA polymerase sigma factor n=1 Tax=unclassified Paenarthrobacter TaxID=2634190 RepID=UPI00344547DF